MLRNLFYSVYATQHSQEWRLNIETLLRHREVFNGRKIVVLRHDENTVDCDEVRRELTLLGGVEFIERRNNPELGETYKFLKDFGSLESLNPNEITFYAHTKGVKYAFDDPRLPAIRNWREAMYRECLSNPERVDGVLAHSACAGAFLRPATNTAWMFAGNFWWVRHDRLFSTSWRAIQPNYYGVERYLGGVLDIQDAHCFAFKSLASWSLYQPLLQVCLKCKSEVIEICTWPPGDFSSICARCGHGMELRDHSSEAQNLALVLKSKITGKAKGRKLRDLLDEFRHKAVSHALQLQVQDYPGQESQDGKHQSGEVDPS
jgi:hypothetical protein